MFCLLTGLRAQSGAKAGNAQADSNPYDSKIRETYNFRFGAGDLSAPGNALSETGGFIQPGAFPSATYCAHCHPQAYSEWRQALHSNSFRTPFYRTSVNILARTKGIEFTRHCDSCHNPIGVLSGALTTNSQVDRKFDTDGVDLHDVPLGSGFTAYARERQFRDGNSGGNGG